MAFTDGQTSAASGPMVFRNSPHSQLPLLSNSAFFSGLHFLKVLMFGMRNVLQCLGQHTWPNLRLCRNAKLQIPWAELRLGGPRTPWWVHLEKSTEGPKKRMTFHENHFKLDFQKTNLEIPLDWRKFRLFRNHQPHQPRLAGWPWCHGVATTRWSPLLWWSPVASPADLLQASDPPIELIGA